MRHLLLWLLFPNLAELRLEGSNAGSNIVYGQTAAAVDGTCVASAKEEEDGGYEAEDGGAADGDAGDLRCVDWCRLCG